MKPRAVIFLALLSSAAHAGPAMSANYAITTGVVDSGGASAASARYSNQGSAGTLGAVSTVASPAGIAKSGYIGQLADAAGLQLTPSPASVNAGQTLQLGASQVLDDGTLIALGPGTVSWGIQSGPLTGITSGGLATAGTVYENTVAVVTGTYGGFSGVLGVTVFNSGFNAWQLKYFGVGNPLAAPGADADGTGQTNLFKYVAGLDPTDPASRFVVAIGPVANQPGQVTITFSPVVTGRSYVVQYCADLVPANWQTLTGATQTINGKSIIVVDPNAGGPRKFYRVQVVY